MLRLFWAAWWWAMPQTQRSRLWRAKPRRSNRSQSMTAWHGFIQWMHRAVSRNRYWLYDVSFFGLFPLLLKRSMTFDALFSFSIFSDDLFRAFTVQTISNFFRYFSFGRRLEKLIIFPKILFSKKVFFKILKIFKIFNFFKNFKIFKILKNAYIYIVNYKFLNFKNFKNFKNF